VKWHAALAAVGALGLAGGLVGGWATALERTYAGRPLPGVTVNQVDVGGLDAGALTRRLEALARPVVQRQVRVRAGDDESTWTASDLGERALIVQTAAAVLAVGRRGGSGTRLRQRLALLRRGVDVPISYAREPDAALQVVRRIAERVEVAPTNAEVAVRDGRLMATSPDHAGVMVDVPASAARILAALDERAATVDLVVERQPAALTADLVGRMAGSIARFTTSYPYNPDRVHNIHLAAAALRGIVLLPDDVLSYNQAVGPRIESRGYRKAPVLVNNELIPGDGGGVCQVSSTLFNAALLADLTVETRTNHSRPVPYLAAGRDATVVYGSIDLRMRNATGAPMVLWTEVTPRSITISVFSLPRPGREIAIIVTDHQVLPAPQHTVVKYDAEVPYGQTKVEPARTGLRAQTFRVVKQDGVVVRRERVAWNYYQPVPRTVRIGTGGRPPIKRAGR
jgi:vancomycin resistance protein YoaR